MAGCPTSPPAGAATVLPPPCEADRCHLQPRLLVLLLLPAYCRACDVRFACHGGCPKDRFIRTPDGEPGLDYLCAGYQRFFRHVDRPMRMMAELLDRGLPPTALMAWYRQQDGRPGDAQRGASPGLGR